MTDGYEWNQRCRGKRQALQWSDSDYVCGGRFSEEDRDLADAVTAAECCPICSLDADEWLALRDHVEVGSAEPLSQDAGARGEHLLIEDAADRLKLRARQASEGDETGEIFGRVLLGHRR